MATDSVDVIEIFCSYSHQDEALKKELEIHLSGMKRQGLIALWSDREIDPGTGWKDEIDSHLESAEVILLLISADFIASDYCYEKEMMRALQRREKGEARAIPIILREVDWKEMPFGKLQALPTDGKAITTWHDHDKAFVNVARGIRNVVEQLRSERRKKTTPDVVYWKLSLQGTVDEINRPEVETILSTLRGYVGNTELELQRIESGSIVCVFASSREGFRRIRSKVDSGELAEIAGLKIEGMGWEANSVELFPPPPVVPSRRTITVQQESQQLKNNKTMTDISFPLTFRAEVIGPLTSKLRTGESCSLLGVAGVGKGNVVRHLQREDVLKLYFLDDAPRTLYLYLDCDNLPNYGEQSVYAEILKVISREVRRMGDIEEALQLTLDTLWREATTDSSRPFARHNLESALAMVLDGPALSMIVVLDDCDGLIAGAAPALLSNLRDIRDDHKIRLKYVTVSRRELVRLRPMSRDFEGFLELFAYNMITVKPYREPDAIFMLERLAARQEIHPRPLSDAAIRRLIEITGGHAGLLKQVYEVSRHGEDVLDPDLMSTLISKQFILAECEKIREDLEDFEASDLQAIALGRVPSGVGVASLKVKGLVIENVDRQLSIFSQLFGEFVRTKPGVDPLKGPKVIIDRYTRSVKIDGRIVSLTLSEFELFRLLYERRPQPCTYDELINRLMSVEPAGNPHRRLVDTLANLRVKIDLPGKNYLVSISGAWRLIGEDEQ